MGSLALFPRRAKPGHVFIHVPIGAKPSDRFGVLTIEHDNYPRIPIGVTVTFKYHSRENNCPHVVEVDEGWIIAVCSFLSNGLVTVEPMRSDYPTVTDTEDKLNILGCITDFYSDPDMTHRWVLWREWMNRLLAVQTPQELVGHRRVGMVWQTDAYGAVTHADPLCCQYLGLSMEQMRAGEWKKRIHPDDRNDYLRSRERAIAEGVVYRNLLRILDARDEYCLMSIMLIPFWDNDQIIAWHAVAELIEDVIKRSA
jgi:PAS domain-containing protein